MRRFLVIAGGLVYALLLPAGAGAQQFNHTITVYAVVPEQRAVYLDRYGAVIKIAGNTTRNIPPQVYDSSSREIPISPAIQEQYDAFLKRHGYHLDAGKIYTINPLSVNNTPDRQTISVAGRQSLALTIK